MQEKLDSCNDRKDRKNYWQPDSRGRNMRAIRLPGPSYSFSKSTSIKTKKSYG